jgi:hypothetical protein
VVIGTFKHQAAQAIDLYVEGQAKPIGTTANHPFWSEDRQSFVAVEELRTGEKLRGGHGPRRVLRIARRLNPEPVYNLEVQGSHVYHVSPEGLLVHNGSENDRIPLLPEKYGLGMDQGNGISVIYEFAGNSTVQTPSTSAR